MDILCVENQLDEKTFEYETKNIFDILANDY